jgi:HEAT repeat protein
MNMLARGEVGRRITAMDLIVRRRMTFAVPQLLASTEDFEPRIRVAAVKRLGELAGPETISAVLQLLNRAKSADDLEAAEQALSALSLKAADPQTGAAQLAAQMPRLRPAQQCVLLRVLAAVGGAKARQTVHAAISSHEPEVHAAAIRVLSEWSTVDAAPELLQLARYGGGSTDQTLCLRGYLRLATLADVPAEKRLEMCRDAATLPTNDDEKKLLLAALGGIHSLASLELIEPYLGDPAIKEEAAIASTDVAEKLLHGNDAAKVAPKLVPLLEKVAEASDNETVTKRAKSLREQAKTKAEGK